MTKIVAQKLRISAVTLLKTDWNTFGDYILYSIPYYIIHTYIHTETIYYEHYINQP